MKIGFAQINPTVGDLNGNFEKIVGAYERLAAAGAELIITPELAITGYPPQDLVFKSQFVPQTLEVLDKLQARIRDAGLLVGYVERNQGRGKPFHNSAALLQPGRAIEKTHKSLLPTYDVFDEDRYFEPARGVAPLTFRGKKIGVTICEDIWTENFLPRPLYEIDPVRSLVEQGAEIILNLSASPFSLGKPAVRREMLATLARAYHRPICYCNAAGGNDQLVFDGNSIAVNSAGDLIAQLPGFRINEEIVDTDSSQRLNLPERDVSADLFEALSLGVRDYLTKCNFKSAVLGLSGGIDSAVVAAVAVEALGPQNVLGVSMPSPYSSQGSIDDALALADNLGIKCLQIPIANAFAAFKAQFGEIFAGLPEDTTEENMQSRLRGMILMSLSNKFGHILLTTGNKSELAVGYCTIYGDMAGGLAVISDVPKTMVYQLARWINSDSKRGEIIPASTIGKPPSAELKPGQTDQDSLPPYDVLDEILRLYVEENMG
ncbi:MAG: NAD+ synthase, partial [Verrucomicrobiota bacterium]|nr:NAD+ synthase [Verrucomicrobiota bacterium]